MRTYISSVLFFAIVLLSVILNFYKLGDIPSGLNQDESAIGYNAYAILKTGKDEHSVTMPLYFKSFNDYKLPGYIYMTSISEKLFGLTPFAVRLPSALFGTLTVVAFFFLVKILSKNTSLSLVSALLLTINPWHIFFSRVAFEVNVAIAFLVFGALFFILALQKKNNIVLYSLSILSFGVSLYTYNVTRIFAPILLGTLVGLHYKTFITQSKIRVAGLAILFVAMILPFALTLFSHSGLSNQQNVLITGGYAKADMVEFRSYLAGLPHIITSFLFNSYMLLLWQYGKNVITSFSTLFFFSSAGNGGDVGVGNVGMFYPIEFITIILGIIFFFKEKTKAGLFFALWGIFLFLLVSISAIVPVGTRNYPVSIAMVFFSAYGLYTSFGYIKAKFAKFFIPSVALVAIVFAYSFMFFQFSYYARFPIAYAKTWRSEDKDLAIYLKNADTRYNHIVIDKDANFTYTSLIFYQEYPPVQYQKDVVYQPDSLFTGVEKVGKYEFRKIDWEKDIKLPNTLFVIEKNSYPPTVTHLKTFAYPTKPIVVSLENKIYQYPVTETAYEVVSNE